MDSLDPRRRTATCAAAPRWPRTSSAGARSQGLTEQTSLSKHEYAQLFRRWNRTRDRLLLTKGTNRLPCDAENSSQSHQCAGRSRAPIGQDCAPCLEVHLQRLDRCEGTLGSMHAVSSLS